MRKAAASALVALASVTALGAPACSEEHDHDGASSLTVVVSGEGDALTGFAFPATDPNAPTFVDGWEVRFDRILVAVDSVALSDGPDTSPTDQSQTGPIVAKKTGPWAVDMTKPGTVTDLSTQARLAPLHGGGDETTGTDPHAQFLTRLERLDDNRSFDPAVRYGFGFETVAARVDATKTNLDAAAEADYADMVQKGISVLYVGTATFRGTSCTSSDAALPEGDRYDFSKLPTSVRFRFGFKTPTQYVNCQNTSLRGKAFDGEEAQRGVQLTANAGTRAQITLHVDHPFWNTVDHDAAELYFDQLAAYATPDGTLSLDDLTTADFTSFKDKAGKAIPWRSCIANKPVREGTRRFDSGSVAVDPQGAPDAALRNYADYVSYLQSTQGHLNADGLCAVKRNFSAPR